MLFTFRAETIACLQFRGRKYYILKHHWLKTRKKTLNIRLLHFQVHLKVLCYIISNNTYIKKRRHQKQEVTFQTNSDWSAEEKVRNQNIPI